MKPTKNRVFCKDCGRQKMLFESEKKAENFIKFNGAEIEEESGFKPERSYYCVYCAGWHVTSHKELVNIKSRTEKVVESFKESVEFFREEKKRTETIRNEINEKLKSSFDLIFKNIEFLDSIDSKNDLEKYTEILNLTIIEFEKINSIGVSSKGRKKQVKLINKKINNFKKETI